MKIEKLNISNIFSLIEVILKQNIPPFVAAKFDIILLNETHAQEFSNLINQYNCYQLKMDNNNTSGLLIATKNEIKNEWKQIYLNPLTDRLGAISLYYFEYEKNQQEYKILFFYSNKAENKFFEYLLSDFLDEKNFKANDNILIIGDINLRIESFTFYDKIKITHDAIMTNSRLEFTNLLQNTCTTLNSSIDAVFTNKPKSFDFERLENAISDHRIFIIESKEEQENVQNVPTSSADVNSSDLVPDFSSMQIKKDYIV